MISYVLWFGSVIVPRTALAVTAVVAIGCDGTGMAAPAVGQRPMVVATPPVAASTASAYELLTVPAGMRLDAELDLVLSSTDSRVDDRVLAVVRSTVTVNERIVIPRGSELRGEVIDVAPSGKVEGRARLAFRFHELFANDEEYAIRTAPLIYRADETTRDDAKTIGLGAGAGALLGAIAGGRKGAALGAAIGGGAGTAAVLSTPGDEIRLMPGAGLAIEMLDPVEIRLFDDEGR
jgi:hypothetical protein